MIVTTNRRWIVSITISMDPQHIDNPPSDLVDADSIVMNRNDDGIPSHEKQQESQSHIFGQYINSQHQQKMANLRHHHHLNAKTPQNSMFTMNPQPSMTSNEDEKIPKPQFCPGLDGAQSSNSSATRSQSLYHYLTPERLMMMKLSPRRNGNGPLGSGHSKSKTQGSSMTISASNIIKSIVTGTIRPKYPGFQMKQEMDQKINALLDEIEPLNCDESVVGTGNNVDREPTLTFNDTLNLDQLQPGLVGPSSMSTQTPRERRASSTSRDMEDIDDMDDDRISMPSMVKTGSDATMIRSDSNNPAASTLCDISYKTSSRRDNLSVPSFGHHNHLNIDFLSQYQRDNV